MNKLTKEEVISRFIDTHGNLYNYNNVDFKRVTDPVTIICDTHGSFNQSPNIHYNGSGCPECAITKNGINLRSNVNEFIQKANIKHNNKFDYSLVEYKTNSKKIKIICNDHGIFEQTPNNHLAGKNCPVCSRELTSNPIINPHKRKYSPVDNERGIFYKLKFTHKELGFSFLKIGITSKSIEDRYKMYKDYNYEIVEEVVTTNKQSAILEYDFMNSTKLEKFIFPEGIKFGGFTECYSLI